MRPRPPPAADANDPWSGYYELYAPFWAQAHLTQSADVGWRVVPASAGGASVSDRGISYMVFASTGVPSRDGIGPSPAPSIRELSVLVVNNGAVARSLSLLLRGLASQLASRGVLQIWRTVDGAGAAGWFRHIGQAKLQPTARQSVDGPWDAWLNVTCLARAIYTFTTRADLQHAEPSVPPRTALTIPRSWTFNERAVGAPGYLLSDAYGAFEVVAVPNIATAGARDDAPSGTNKVLRQSAPAPPIHWTVDNPPFTALPSGTNFLNYEVSVRASLQAASQGPVPPTGPVYAVLCGRIPIWPMRRERLRSLSPPIGVCLVVNQTHWRLSELDGEREAVRRSGRLASRLGWRALALRLEGGIASATVDTVVVAGAVPVARTNGVAGFGCGWHLADFDDFELRPLTPPHDAQPRGSFLLDVVPGQTVRNNLTGEIGTILELSAGERVLLTHIGRYVVAGSHRPHNLSVQREDDALGVRAAGAGARPARALLGRTVVDLAVCQADLLGFCYGRLLPALPLQGPARFHILSSELTGGDGWLEMHDPASASTMQHRISSTLLTHKKPGLGLVAGRVVGDRVIGERDTMAGPLNWLLAS